MSILKSKIDEILEKLTEENKVTFLDNETTEDISDEINQKIDEFRQDYLKKENESLIEAGSILINS